MLDPAGNNFEDHIAEDEIQVAELYEVELSTGVIHYYTAYDKEVKWGDPEHIYLPISIERSEIASNINMQADSVEIRIGIIDGALVDLIQANILDAVKITIKRVLIEDGYAAGNEIVVFIGAADIAFDRKVLILNCISILDTLNIRVPRNLYQEPCNNRLFDPNCSVAKADYKYVGVATSNGGDNFTVRDTSLPAYKVAFDAGDETNAITMGDTITGQTNGYTAVVVGIAYVTASTGFIWYVDLSNAANFNNNEVLASAGDQVTVNGTPTEDTSFYALGETKCTTGNNEGQRRMIRVAGGDSFITASAFPNEVVTGTSFDLYPGCDKRPLESCLQKFDSKQFFNGHIYIPKSEEAFY